MKLTIEQTATMLAALRLWQETEAQNEAEPMPERFLDIATNGGKVKRLTDKQIDRLCEHINCGPSRAKREIAICKYCGSEDVLADAYAEWDRDEQQWTIHNVFDKGAVCEKCDGDTRIVFKPMKKGAPHAKV